MTTFTVYKHPVFGYEVVKDGFSWPAFFFGWIWALVKRLWVTGVLLLVFVQPLIAFGVWALGTSDQGPFIGLVIVIAIPTVIGFFGNSWRRSSLQKRGFTRLRQIQAPSADSALATLASET